MTRVCVGWLPLFISNQGLNVMYLPHCLGGALVAPSDA